MSGPQLAFISTVLWVIGTGAVFVLLANWSAGGSWGLSAAIIRGVREWTRSEPTSAPEPTPEPGARPPEATKAAADRADLVDLGSRPTGPP